MKWPKWPEQSRFRPYDGAMTWQPNSYAHGHLVVVIDCVDLERAALFWAGALGYADEGAAGETYRTLVPADGPGIEVLLQRTADEKHGKNRLHLDLRTRDLEAEIARVVALGAAQCTEVPIEEGGWAWHVLADPDGNEFCVLRPPSDYWANPAG
jgi:predicted enzyme related to lactoylglutathione lyase